MKLHQTYPLINETSPEPGTSSRVRIRGHQRRPIIPDLVYVLNNDEGLTHRFPVMDENWDLLVNGVYLQKQLDFVTQILLLVLLLDTLLGQRNPDSHPKHASPGIQQNHLVRHCYTKTLVRERRFIDQRWLLLKIDDKTLKG